MEKDLCVTVRARSVQSLLLNTLLESTPWTVHDLICSKELEGWEKEKELGESEKVPGLGIWSAYI
jgi:hypothetical protein